MQGRPPSHSGPCDLTYGAPSPPPLPGSVPTSVALLSFPSLVFLFFRELPRDWATVGPAGAERTQWNPCEAVDPSCPLPTGPVEHSSALPKTSLNLVPLENQTKPVGAGRGGVGGRQMGFLCPRSLSPYPTPLPLHGPHPWST